MSGLAPRRSSAYVLPAADRFHGAAYAGGAFREGLKCVLTWVAWALNTR